MPLRCQAATTLSSSLYCIGFGLVWAGIYNPPPPHQMLTTLSGLRLHALLQHGGIWLAVPPELGEVLNQCCTGQVGWEGRVGWDSNIPSQY